jgi:hypothetical protein
MVAIASILVSATEEMHLPKEAGGKGEGSRGKKKAKNFLGSLRGGFGRKSLQPISNQDEG